MEEKSKQFLKNVYQIDTDKLSNDELQRILKIIIEKNNKTIKLKKAKINLLSLEIQKLCE